ncbi:recombinase family protein [Streptomyces sp. TRM70350]|nr:recombinase family protein [Streptomyces sp. TRM70350]
MPVPQFRAELEVRIPADRGPGRYARCSTAQQELQSRLDALGEAGCGPVVAEKISTRGMARPEFVKAMDFARTIRKAVPHQRVMFTVHEMKRPGRGAELLTIAEDLRHHDIQLELLTGPLQQSEREYIREKSLEGQASARERGRHGGRPEVVDDMAAYARSLRANGVPVPQVACKVLITSGQEQGRTPLGRHGLPHSRRRRRRHRPHGLSRVRGPYDSGRHPPGTGASVSREGPRVGGTVAMLDPSQAPGRGDVPCRADHPGVRGPGGGCGDQATCRLGLPLAFPSGGRPDRCG